MSKRVILDRDTLAAELARLDDAPGDPRPARLDHLKRILAEARAEVERRFLAGSNGARSAADNCAVMDAVIGALHVSSGMGAITIVAVGGYGRGELAPFSDLDLLFLLPARTTARIKKHVEFMLYMLWDLGLKLGQATRTVAQCLGDARGDMTIRTGLLEARLVAGDGQLLVPEHGARVLACRLPGIDGNLFWHSPAMQAPDTAQHPAGGDRLWIAPEVGWFWPSIEKAREDPGKYAATPPQIDPGEYLTDSASPVHAQLATRIKLTDVRDGKSIELAVSRQVRAVGPPSGLPDALICASFAITNILLLRGGDDGAIAGAWDILQIPPTGTLICPTTTPVTTTSGAGASGGGASGGGGLRSYYDPFGESHVICDEQSVRFLVDGQRKIKMGLLAEHTTGRMAYYRKLDPGRSSLIVRIFAPMPGEPYADLPIHEDKTKRTGGDTLQAYNDDGNAGGFGEMEYHDPALTAADGPASRTGTCITHVLAGPDDTLRAFGRTLLGVPIQSIR